jgi:aminocarboxymuconate-semialdehyde decarboxylase
MTTAPIPRIDVHAHCFPETFLRALARLYPEDVTIAEPRDNLPLFAYWAQAPLPAWDIERRLSEMDRDHVELEILSAPSVYHRMDEHTAELCRMLNDAQARAARSHPKRFRSFVHLPVHDLDAARQELDRWLGKPEVAGINLATHMGDMYPGDARLEPLWRWIHEASLPVFIHPVKPCGLTAPVHPVVFSFPHDTALAAASLIYSGVFDRLPDLKIILSHYGGALPVLAKRLDIPHHPHFPPAPGADLAAAPSTYAKRFFVDTAQGFHQPGFDAARTAFGLDHLLYGSDHFFHESPWRADLNTFLDSLSLSPAETEALLRGNAERLLERR